MSSGDHLLQEAKGNCPQRHTSACVKLQKGDITQQHVDIGDVLVDNHLFVIFAVLDCVIRR